MGSGTERIAHVVQTVEEGNEVQPGLGEVLRCAHFEARVPRHAMRTGVCAGSLDRRRMEVVSDELRLRERLGHRDGRPAMSAPDIGYLGATIELVGDAVEGG